MIGRLCLLLAACWPLLAGAERLTLFALADTGDCRTAGAAKVSAALRAQPDWEDAILLEVGDLAYPEASRERLQKCHEPHFAMFRRRLAVPGNHDYADPGAAGFFGLFPEALPRAVPLTGRWQLWLLDSNLRGSAWERQLAWLQEARRAAAGRCLIAAWHHPRWSSGQHGSLAEMGPLWERVAGVATLTLHGHDHHYEALPPLDRAGRPADGGTRAFIVGNGGTWLYKVHPGQWPSVVAGQRWGFLRLELDGDGYHWRALATDGQILDSGSGRCRALPEQ